MYLTDFSPIGYVECAQRYRYEAARQASIAPDNEAWIQLNEDRALQEGLAGLADFERIWVLCELHLNETWHALVEPPREGMAKLGDLGTGYITLADSFAEGGYEPVDAFVSGESEALMRAAIDKILRS